MRWLYIAQPLVDTSGIGNWTPQGGPVAILLSEGAAFEEKDAGHIAYHPPSGSWVWYGSATLGIGIGMTDFVAKLHGGASLIEV